MDFNWLAGSFEVSKLRRQEPFEEGAFGSHDFTQRAESQSEARVRRGPRLLIGIGWSRAAATPVLMRSATVKRQHDQQARQL